MTGSEDAVHAALRASVAAFVESLGVVLGGVLDVSTKSLAAYDGEMRTNGVYVGEDAVLIIPDAIQRDITVHIAFDEPLLYRPSSGLATGPSLQIAFYEGLGSDPGHYRAIVSLSLCEQLPSVAPSKNAELSSSSKKKLTIPHMFCKSCKFSVLHFNARFICNKFSEVEADIKVSGARVICITKTWLTSASFKG